MRKYDLFLKCETLGGTGTEQLETVVIACPRSLITHLDIFYYSMNSKSMFFLVTLRLENIQSVPFHNPLMINRI